MTPIERLEHLLAKHNIGVERICYKTGYFITIFHLPPAPGTISAHTLAWSHWKILEHFRLAIGYAVHPEGGALDARLFRNRPGGERAYCLWDTDPAIREVLANSRKMYGSD